MRDWLTAFRPASFRGVPFKVDGEGMAGQRRLSISPIAYADSSVIEDMGRDPMIWPVTAYLAGDFADREAQALTAALSLKGPGLLVLPMHGAVRARA
jgi:prophage DNA circulation protein